MNRAALEKCTSLENLLTYPNTMTSQETFNPTVLFTPGFDGILSVTRESTCSKDEEDEEESGDDDDINPDSPNITTDTNGLP
ncbi:hypothetical protein HDU76_007439 [Blyttiomyces sp. JEL0837]|nr:hypothetical protein HDU76_007439 [Blyttiomyces sp. JEL0837]